MKKSLVYLILIFTLIVNVGLIFYWKPQEENVIPKDNSKETISYTKSLYKVDKYKLLEKLSIDDKKNLERILKKLSTYDIGKMQEFFNDSNDQKGLIDIFTLLKKRLTEADYKQIESISSSYVDMESINKKMKK